MRWVVFILVIDSTDSAFYDQPLSTRLAYSADQTV